MQKKKDPVNGLLVGVMAMVLVATIFAFVSHVLWAAIFGCAFLVVGTVLIVARFRGVMDDRSGSSPTKEMVDDAVAAVSDAGYDFTAAVNSVTKTNLALRTAEGVSDVVLSATESVVDKLLKFFEQYNPEKIGNDLAYVVNQMATKYLPLVTGQYLEIDIANRNEAQMVEALQGMAQQLTEISDMIEGRRAEDFAAASAFLSALYTKLDKKA